jgi:hypothetical protein
MRTAFIIRVIMTLMMEAVHHHQHNHHHHRWLYSPTWVLVFLRTFCQLKYSAVVSSDFVTSLFQGSVVSPTPMEAVHTLEKDVYANETSLYLRSLSSTINAWRIAKFIVVIYLFVQHHFSFTCGITHITLFKKKMGLLNNLTQYTSLFYT